MTCTACNYKFEVTAVVQPGPCREVRFEGGIMGRGSVPAWKPSFCPNCGVKVEPAILRGQDVLDALLSLQAFSPSALDQQFIASEDGFRIGKYRMQRNKVRMEA